MPPPSMRSGSVPAHARLRPTSSGWRPTRTSWSSWIDDDGYPDSVATAFETDVDRGTVRARPPAGMPIPTDREVSVIGSHIRPQPGIGYDERRYLQLWGRIATAATFTPTRAWGWDEAEVPFFEYSERSVPAVAPLPRGALGGEGPHHPAAARSVLAGAAHDAPAVPVGHGGPGAARDRRGRQPRRVHLVDRAADAHRRHRSRTWRSMSRTTSSTRSPAPMRRTPPRPSSPAARASRSTTSSPSVASSRLAVGLFGAAAAIGLVLVGVTES